VLAESPTVTKVWVNDKDVGIACLWTAVFRYHDEFKERVRAFAPSVAAFYDLREELGAVRAMPEEPCRIVEIGFKKLAIHQISYSGLGTKSGGPLGGAGQKSKYKIACRWSPDHICKKVDMIHSHFQGVEVHGGGCTSLGFADVIEETSCRCLLYLDPPYYVKGSDLYQCGFTHEDHVRLATLLRDTKHPWVLSYDDCQEVRQLYAWACVERLDVNYSITALKDRATGERLSRTKGELLIYPERAKGIEGVAA
jgi:DNA adenine methylase